jgi:hypothetical protein
MAKVKRQFIVTIEADENEIGQNDLSALSLRSTLNYTPDFNFPKDEFEVEEVTE